MNRQVTHHTSQVGGDLSPEQYLYEHFLGRVTEEPPEEVLERFRLLFLEGSGYPDREVQDALEYLIQERISDQEFVFLLNRCCHILINRWQINDRHSQSITELIHLLSQTPINRTGTLYRARSVSRLHRGWTAFQESEQFLALLRLVQVLEAKQPVAQPMQAEPLGQLIRRYPYLYDHCLVSEGSDYAQQKQVLTLRTQHQNHYESNLSLYLTYQVRGRELARQGVRDPAEFRRRLKPVANPTFLNNPELAGALRHYAGKSNQGKSSKEMAQQFSHYASQSRTFGKFKSHLHEYIMLAMGGEAGYANRTFSRQLTQHLQQISPESEAGRLNDFLMIRTCSQVVNFMVVESPRKAEHFVFMDLLNNLGPQGTIGVLLKLVLFCTKVKPYLEKRFSILFTHYESNTQENTIWLIHALEHLQLALTANFGGLKIPFRI
ncbi:MAG: hypothetical protein ACO4AI_04905 [Prochlorothrix sp.]